MQSSITCYLCNAYLTSAMLQSVLPLYGSVCSVTSVMQCYLKVEVQIAHNGVDLPYPDNEGLDHLPPLIRCTLYHPLGGHDPTNRYRHGRNFHHSSQRGQERSKVIRRC